MGGAGWGRAGVRQVGLNWIWQGSPGLKWMNRAEQDGGRARAGVGGAKSAKAGPRLAEQVRLGLKYGWRRSGQGGCGYTGKAWLG